jgi:F-type H+-transporting ATPase subunit c
MPDDTHSYTDGVFPKFIIQHSSFITCFKGATSQMYLAALAFGVTMGLPIAVLGAGLGQGRVGAAAMEGIARQPEAAGRIQTAMIIALALIEALVIYSLLMFFVANGKLPKLTPEQAVEMYRPAAVTTTAP